MTLGDTLNVTSPNYPVYYHDNQECIWYITNNVLGTFLIEVIDMVLHPIPITVYEDAFDIGFGLDHTLSDSILLSTRHILPQGTMIRTEEGSMWMMFRSGRKYRQKGFKLKWQVVSTQERRKCKSKLTGNL